MMLYDEEIISYLSKSDDVHSRNLSKYKKEDITKSDQSNSSEIDSLIVFASFMLPPCDLRIFIL